MASTRPPRRRPSIRRRARCLSSSCIIPRTDRDEAVRRSVAALPSKYRDAVVLYYFHEMDVAGASRTLGIPEGTLKARLDRGRPLLERKLAELHASRRTAEAR